MDARRATLLDVLNPKGQFLVPPYQRRYRWGSEQISDLFEDVLDAARHVDAAHQHYTGALVVHPDPEPRVENIPRWYIVDGQQRLTTISMMLAAIGFANNGGDPASSFATLADDYLWNRNAVSTARRYRLELQDPDASAWRSIVNGAIAVDDASPISTAWAIIQGLVSTHSLPALHQGLQRLEFVLMTLSPQDDPQQIFESLNAKGLPLEPIEKVKNYIFTGQSATVQLRLNHTRWRQIERFTGAHVDAGRATDFLKRLLHWKTGRVHGAARPYRQFQLWRREPPGRPPDTLDAKAALCDELHEAARDYSTVVYAEPSAAPESARQLELLRLLNTTVHLPVCLRLLAEQRAEIQAGEPPRTVDVRTAEALAVIGRWLTRAFYASPNPGLNKAVVDLTGRIAYSDHDDKAAVWEDAISGLRLTGQGVPGDGDLVEATLNRRAYGGGATKITKAVLYGIARHGALGNLPGPVPLTVEHVMPRKLTPDWQRDLGPDAPRVHERWVNRIANLVLVAPPENSTLGTRPFAAKAEVLRRTTIPFTRSVAEYPRWTEAELLDRSDRIAAAIAAAWPWPREGVKPASPVGGNALPRAPGVRGARRRSRVSVGGGPVREYASLAEAVRQTTAALLEIDSGNAGRLAGDKPHADLLRSGAPYRAGETVRGCKLVEVPGHPDWLMSQADSAAALLRKIRVYAERCGVSLEIS